MAEFRRIQITLFVILLLQFTAVTGQNPLSFTVRAGDDVTLPCENVIKQKNNCYQTTWLSSRKGEAAVALIELGQVKNQIPKTKSDRLSVTEKCSLVIKNVTCEDVGRYTCRQFYKSGGQQGPEAVVHLSVVNIEEHLNTDTVILICSVLTYDGCDHTVKWLYEGNENDVEISTHTCSASVTFPSHLNQKLLKCNVTDKKNGNTLQFDVSLRSSHEETGRWRVIMGSVGLAALVITVVAVNIWIRTKGNRTQMDGNAEHHDEDEGTVTYENVGEPSVSIRLH
ncbi:uncharacterized protein LOC144533206 isoform X5 [Sander vitreus]